jgi:hypothetical protein
MKKFLLTAAAFLIMSATTCATAQVTIGSTAVPQEFSILELESNGALGLRLPQMTTAQRDNMVNSAEFQAEKSGKAQGLQIFNTNTMCVETWNGTKWIEVCGEPEPEPEPDPWVCLPAPACDGIDIPLVCFAKFNLGADPQYDTPKKQMQYLAEHDFSELYAHVYGGLYQWGRKDTLYAVNAANFTRYNGTTNATSGQTSVPDATTFYYGYQKWYNGSDPDKLWGNGVLIDTQTTPDGVLYGEANYQSTKWVHSENDPCPDGFRVPTQDEWERLGAYDCIPSTAGGYLTTTVSGGNTGKGLTWVPVVCTNSATEADRRCVPNSPWTTNSTSAGYAIYETAEWEKAITTTGVYAEWAGNSPTNESFNSTNDGNYKYPSLHSDAAGVPEPLLFLPAAGFRSGGDGIIGDTGVSGYYWSSTVSKPIESFSRVLYFSSNGGVSPNTNSTRATGLSIRCVVE